MRIIYLLMILLVLTNCIERPRTAFSEPDNSVTENFYSAIDTSLIWAIKELDSLKLSVTDNPDSLYLLVYFGNNDYRSILEHKEIVDISYLRNYEVKELHDYYKGIIEVDSIQVLIFDEDDLGSGFYDSTLLVKRPLESISTTPIKINISSVFKIMGDSLVFWHPPL